MTSGGRSATESAAATGRSSSSNKLPTNQNGNAQSSRNGSIFITEGGGITLPSFCWLIGMPLLLSGRILYGVIAIVVGLIFAVRKAMDDFIQEKDKHEIRYNVLHPDDIVSELEDLESSIGSQDESQKQQQSIGTTSITSPTEAAMQCTASLMALAKKFNQKQSPDNLPMLAQQASYICLRLFPDDDEVITGSISLLALIAKDGQVRNRHKYQKDDYGLKLPITSIRKALQRAQNLDETDENKEEQLAELQRKGCLWLGALADTGNSSDSSSAKPKIALATMIVEQDGLDTILDAANWFRYHDGVVNWALWAIFILCYDDATGSFCKARLVQLGGINTICTSLKNIPDSLEVNRHGIAILFDLLRQHDQQQQSENSNSKNTSVPRLDPWEVRKVALASGLHDVVKNAMIEFADSMDIMMMGQEMLIGTGYRGDIPQYQQF